MQPPSRCADRGSDPRGEGKCATRVLFKTDGDNVKKYFLKTASCRHEPRAQARRVRRRARPVYWCHEATVRGLYDRERWRLEC